MPSTLYNSTGQTITLDKKIGEGGEGYVCTVQGSQFSNQVAKIYHITHLPDADKQEKLRYMVDNGNTDLTNYIAWATDTLHKRQGGRIVGFLMPKVADCYPIHTLYNPSYRKKSYPQLTWEFLIYTARNIASAFATIHKQGHVIGDVNQGNLLFNLDSKVTLIDADSFQITTADTTHLCPVGVAHFTPPELQGNTNFATHARTTNHDNFGLALLIFHVLMGGRHPFAGVPLIEEAGRLLETDIKAYRYAYAPDNYKRGMKPPPTAITIDLVPPVIAQLFISAFTEIGIQGRPTAEDWLTALDTLRSNSKTCLKQKRHVFSNHLSSCMWCELEKKGLVHFVDKPSYGTHKTHAHTTHTHKEIEVLLDKHDKHDNEVILLHNKVKHDYQNFTRLKSYNQLNALPLPSSFQVIAKPLPDNIFALMMKNPLFYLKQLGNRIPKIKKTTSVDIMFFLILVNMAWILLSLFLLLCWLFIAPLFIAQLFIAQFIVPLFFISSYPLLVMKFSSILLLCVFFGISIYQDNSIIICIIFIALMLVVVSPIDTMPSFLKPSYSEDLNRQHALSTATYHYDALVKDITTMNHLISNYEHKKKQFALEYQNFIAHLQRYSQNTQKNYYQKILSFFTQKQSLHDDLQVSADEINMLINKLQSLESQILKLQHTKNTHYGSSLQSVNYSQVAKKLAQAQADYDLVTQALKR